MKNRIINIDYGSIKLIKWNNGGEVMNIDDNEYLRILVLYMFYF